MNWRRPANLNGVIERLLIVVAAALWIYVGWSWLNQSADPLDVQPSDASADTVDDRRRLPPRVTTALNDVNRRNIFSPPRPEGFQGQVVGILGDKVYFSNQQTAAVGDTVMGATVLAIGPDWVEIEFEGDKRRLPVFREGGGGDGPPSFERRRGRGGWEGRRMRRPGRGRD